MIYYNTSKEDHLIKKLKNFFGGIIVNAGNIF
jgi:hypothetical protein